MSTRRRVLLATLFIFFVGLLSPTALFAANAEYQTCNPSTSCSIGEFLYDDEYAPISSATCTITSRDPSGTLYLNGLAMTAAADGWYSYTFTAPTTTGIYRTQVCCTSGSDYMCLDKTFQVKSTTSTSLTASDVWSYSTRTVTSFGDLISNIWNNSARTLTSADVNVTTTLSGLTDAEAATLNSLLTETRENRQMLETLVNKPIIKTFIDEGEPEKFNVQQKVEDSRTSATNLYNLVAQISSQAELLDLKLSDMTSDEISTQIDSILNILKPDPNQESLLTVLSKKIKDDWGSLISFEIADHAQAILDNATLAKQIISNFPNSPSRNSAIRLLTSRTRKLLDALGHPDDSSDISSFFAFLSKSDLSYEILDKNNQTLISTLEKYNSTDQSSISQTISNSLSEILNINLLPDANKILDLVTPNQDNVLKNKIYRLLAIIDANKRILAYPPSKAVKVVWLEEGSVIFRAVITNPSHSATQKVPLRYFLPPEVKEENIIKADPALKIDFDANENALAASTEVTLYPQETRTYIVEVEDIWKINEKDLLAIKRQALDIRDSLRDTPLYAQGTSLKSDIDVIVDKIISRQNTAFTPESRIRANRDAKIDLVGVDQKLTALKALANQTDGKKGILGYLISPQATGFWIFVVIALAVFVFAFVYSKSLAIERSQFVIPVIHDFNTGTLPNNRRLALKAARTNAVKTLRSPKHLTRLLSTIMITGSSLFAGARFIEYRLSHNLNTPLFNPVPSSLSGKSFSIFSMTSAFLSIPTGEKVIFKDSPDDTGKAVLVVSDSNPVIVFGQKDDYVKVGFTDSDRNNNWWVDKNHLQFAK